MARVAFVTTSYPRHDGDPSGHFVEAEAKLRLGCGDFVTVLAPGPARKGSDGPLVQWLPGGDAFGWPGALGRLRERPYRVVSAAAFVVAARRALAELGTLDEVIAHWMVPSAWPIADARAATLEVVLHGSDVRLVERLPRAGRRSVVERLLDRGARFRFVSHELRDRLARATTNALLARSRVEPCVIDVSSAPSRREARERFQIADHERVAVVVGRVVPSKRPLEAVRLALREAAERVIVIGDGPLLPALENADPRVTFLGRLPRPDTLAWIVAADVLVSASRDEGASTVVREARAVGTRVVATPSGDLRAWARADPGISIANE